VQPAIFTIGNNGRIIYRKREFRTFPAISPTVSGRHGLSALRAILLAPEAIIRLFLFIVAL